MKTKLLSYMTKNLKLICASFIALLLMYVLTIFIKADFFRLVRSSSVALTVFAILSSGSLVSGDRQRGNYQSNPARTTKSVLDSWRIVGFAMPFYLVLLLDYLF